MAALMAGKVNRFMCRNARKSLNAQSEVGVKLRNCEQTLGTIASDLGWHRNTLDSYFPANRDTQPAKLPTGALWDILESDTFPADCKELLTPDGWALVRVTEQIDLDELARRCREFLARKGEAHCPESPAGRDLSDCENGELIVLAEQVKGAA